MTQYRVLMSTTASFYMTVEADDEDGAIQAAAEEAPYSPCAHCSGWNRDWSVEYGEWDVLDDEDGVVLVGEDGAA